jgi:hypothetical protein
MHCMTHRSHQIQKHKFSVTCLGPLFMKTKLSPPELEKYCVDVSQPGHTGMYFVTCNYHRMQKHKVSPMCLDALFLNPYRSHSSMKNSASMFHGLDAPKCTTWPTNLTGCKNTIYPRNETRSMQKVYFSRLSNKCASRRTLKTARSWSIYHQSKPSWIVQWKHAKPHSLISWRY